MRTAISVALEKAEVKGRAGWIDIYEARRLNILLLAPEETLQTIVSSLQGLVEAKVPAAPPLQTAFDELKGDGANNAPHPIATASRLRLLLLDVTEAAQWDDQKRYLTRQKTKEAANRLVWCWAVTFVLFILPYVYVVIAFTRDATTNFETSAAIVPWTVLTAGLMGALFSRLIYVQANWTSLSLDQVEDAKLWSSILLRGSVGMCGAVLIFLFIRSGVAGGSLLPDFSQVGLTKIAGIAADAKQGADMKLAFVAPRVAFSLLIIWCFLAGFSERFVPDILAATERKLNDSASK